MIDGCSRLGAHFRVLLPVTRPGIVAAFIFNIDWGSTSAAAVLTIAPTTVLFAFAGPHIVQGLTSGAVNGRRTSGCRDSGTAHGCRGTGRDGYVRAPGW